MHPETLAEAFLRAAGVTGLGVRFWHKPGKSEFFSYQELLYDGFAIADALRKRGLQPGERVAIILPTHPDFYRAYFGIVLAGGVPAALYPPVRLGRIQEWQLQTASMLRDIESAGVIADKRLLGLLADPLALSKPRTGCLSAAKLLSEGDELNREVTDSGRLAAVQFSSGTTGNPMPIALSHQNMISAVLNILALIPDRKAQSGMSWLPLYHDMGLIGCMLLAIVGQGPLTLMRPEQFIANPRLWLEALTETKATISVAPNFAFGLVANKVDDFSNLDLSHWRIALCGAETIHKRTLERFAQRSAAAGFQKIALTPVYGLAEATLAVTFSRLDQTPQWQSFDFITRNGATIAVPKANGRDLVCLGKPVGDTSVLIKNDSGENLPENHIGQVTVKGDGIMLGYLNHPEATQAILDPNGWLDTGDIGFIHDNNLFLCGRKKDVMIVNGRNHDPALVEQSIEEVAGVRAGCCAVFSIDDEGRDTERIVVVAEVRGEDVQAAEIAKNVKAAILKYTGLPVFRVELVAPGTVLKTSSGKVRRQATKEAWQKGFQAPVKNAGLWLFLKESLRGLVRYALRKGR